MTYQIIITEETAANIIIDNNTTNVSITTNEYPITIEYNAVIEQAGGNAYGNSNVAAYLASSSLAGNIITSANISGAYILGNGSQLTGLPATYGNANVAANLAAFANNPISTSGNITAGYFAGNGSQLTGLPVQPGTYSNANVQAFLPTYSGNIGELTVNGNLTVTGTTSTVNTEIVNVSESVVGNVDAGNLRTAGQVSATGNITGSYFIGNGSLLTGIATSTYGNANVANFLANGFSSNTITTTGNITAGNINTANYVAFGTTGAQTTAATGQMFWDATEQTVSLGMNNGVTQQIGLEQYILVKASATITNGQAVMFTGAAGDNIQAAPADTTSVGFRPEYIIGVATQDIANNAFGYITTFGKVRGLNTLAYTVGDILWVSNATPGALTATQPTDPNYQIEVAAVTKVSGGDGQILVRVSAFNNLNNLTDVTITTPSTGQALVYAGNVWVNGNPQQANIANVANSVAGANVTGTVANAAYATSAGSATTATTANTVTNNAQANITSVGTLTSLSVSGNVDAGNLRTAGLISATGNINGGNVFVPINGKYYGDFTTGTTAGRTVFQTTATGTSAATSLTAVPGPNHITSNTAFSSQINLFASGADLGNSSFGRMQMFGNRLNFEATAAGTGAIGNMRFAAGSAQIVLLNTGNVGIGNANPTHAFSTNESYIAGNISVNGNVIGGNVNTTGEVTATGNITGSNLVATANLTSTQQTVVGTANVGTTGNIVMSGKNIATDMAFLPDGGNAATAVNGRIVVGTGWLGNISHSTIQNRLLVQDTFVRGNTGTAVQLFASDPIVSLTANVTNGSFRVQGVGSRVRIGGGPDGNTMNLVSPGAGSVGAVAALQPNIDVGNVSPYLLGNTLVSHAVLNGGFFTIHSGGLVGNAYGMVPGITRSAGGLAVSGNTTNYTGFTNNLNNVGNVTNNLYAFYHGNNSSQSSTGISINDTARAATNYYFLRNDDDVAQTKLGSLRFYNEYQATPANTTGTVNIDKSLGQVQLFTPTGNVTIGDFQNFVFNASNSQSNIAQTDTVTVIITQGATPYTVTMPTGNASIKYAGGVSTIGATANAATMISITGTKVGNAATAGTGLYLVTVSSEFS